MWKDVVTQPRIDEKRRRFIKMGILAIALIGDPLLSPKALAAPKPPAIIIRKAPEFAPFSKIGLNVDPKINVMDQSPDFLKRALGVSWVRFSLDRKFNYTDYLNQADSAGVIAVPVVDKETIKEVYRSEKSLFDPDYLAAVARHYAEKYPQIRHLQIGNEPDDTVGDHSWGQNANEYNALSKAFNEAMPDKFLILAGMSTGKSDYLKGIDLTRFQAVAPHVYGASTTEFPNPRPKYTTASIALENYLDFGLPAIVTEVGVNDQVYTPEEASLYRKSLLEFYKNAPEVLGVGYYCLNDQMNDYHGLYYRGGQPKEYSVEAFVQVAREN